ncbi:MAG: aroE [Rickettsiaceae bacterium]|jgi:shikimate dehydrogenase|nr:aroE [Rickettsiaceae bacterium]
MVLKKVAVIGYPVKHSLSPKLHGYWLEKYKDELRAKGIEGEYGMVEVTPDSLEYFLKNMAKNGYAGCNITVPHKERAFEIIRQIGEVSEIAKLIGAVNAVVVQDDGKLFGTNTDAYGYIENIKRNANGFDFTAGKAVVLGAGGAARAVVAGLIDEKGPQIILLNRTKDKAEKIKVDLGNVIVADWQGRGEILKDTNLLVNTTVLGMTGQPELDINLEKLPTDALVTDIVYKPLETNLLKNARNRGNKVVDGLGMLLYQAQGGFELWFGMKPEVTEDLRKHILS